MNNLLLKIRSLKPERILIYHDDESEPLTVTTAGKSAQSLRAILEAENPVKVRLLIAEETVYAWSQEQADEPPPPAGAGEMEGFLRLMLKAQEGIGKVYAEAMAQNARHIEAILKAQGTVIQRLETRVSDMDERLQDTLDVHMDKVLNQAPPVADDAPGDPAAGPMSLDQIITMLGPVIELAMAKKQEK